MAREHSCPEGRNDPSGRTRIAYPLRFARDFSQVHCPQTSREERTDGPAPSTVTPAVEIRVDGRVDIRVGAGPV